MDGAQILDITKHDHDILYVEDDMADAALLCSNFKQSDTQKYRITHSATFKDALDKLKAEKFGAVLLDLNLPDGKGLNAIDDIRRINPDLPVVIITGLDDEITAVQALERGAQEYIVKNHINNDIIRRILQSSILRKRVERALTQKAYTDPLTGLPNRISFEQSARNLLVKAKRWNTTEALLFIDLNKFKIINDTHGHEAGNIVLIETAKRLKETLRESDLIARYAGDEFICYLDSNGAMPINRKLCKAIAEKITAAVEQPINIDDRDITISLSIGIALFPEAGENFDALLNNADAAMYEAKKHNDKKYCFVEKNANIEMVPAKVNEPDFLDIIRQSQTHKDFLSHKELLENEDFYADFSTTLAHDLKSPVRKIVTFSELLFSQYQGLKEEDVSHFLQRISVSANRLNHLLEKLLDFGQSAQRGIQKDQFALSYAVENLLEDMEPFLKVSNARVQVEALPDVASCIVSIRQVLIHLIANAVFYAKNQETPFINISYKIDNGGFIIYVKDNGIGIPESKKEEIFKPFIRLHSADQIEGTGLGLTISKKLIENQGGKIWVDKTNTNGSTLCFTIPAS